MFAFNPLIDYRIHIKLHEHEVVGILDILSAYYNLLQEKDEDYYSLVSAILIGYKIGKILRIEHEKRLAKSQIGFKPIKSKPYTLRLNKLELIWLYHLTRGLGGFDDLRVNRLGPYIITDIPNHH